MDDNSTIVIVRRLEEMLTLQESVNGLINFNWRAASNPWYRAIWTECAELVEHIGWKWWKEQIPNAQQIELELVDIFHFGLSQLLQNGSIDAVVTHSKNIYVDFANASLVENIDRSIAITQVEDFASNVLRTRSFKLEEFCQLCKNFGLSEISLYEKYVGKNVLNRFRQDHGYKSGKYVKIWRGREDNEWLTEISIKTEKNPATFAGAIYGGLAEIYAEVINGQ
jgi:dimeric dUTPase (all-alpha-NTP-PPase superfamily)